MHRLGSAYALVLLTLVTSNCSSDAIVDPAAGGSPNHAGAGGGSAAGTAGMTSVAGTGSQGMPPLPLSCGELLGSSECDPVSGWPCRTLNGDTCDYDAGAFVCLPGPHEAAFCEPCDGETALCGAGMSCDADYHVCVHYCCIDSDCGRGSCAHQNAFGVGELADMGFCQQERVSLCSAPAGGAPADGPGDAAAGAGGQGG